MNYSLLESIFPTFPDDVFAPTDSFTSNTCCVAPSALENEGGEPHDNGSYAGRNTTGRCGGGKGEWLQDYRRGATYTLYSISLSDVPNESSIWGMTFRRRVMHGRAAWGHNSWDIWVQKLRQRTQPESCASVRSGVAILGIADGKRSCTPVSPCC